MFRKQSKISKELYQLLSRQNPLLSHSKYRFNRLVHLNPILLSRSDHVYYKCNHRKSKFHSSPHLYEQEQEQIQETEPEGEVRKPTLEQTEETRNTKIDFIVDEIAKLNLLEVAQLVSNLKTRLNLPDTAMMGAPMMGSMPAAAAAPAGTTEEAEPEITQTIFDVVLKGFASDKKVSIIKEVRGLYKLGLKEAKELVEKAPCTLQAQVPKVEADEVKEKLEAVGAQIELD